MNTIAQKKKYALMILIITLTISFYWIAGNSFNVYDSIVLGAVYEMTSLLTLAATFVLPVFILVLAISNKFRLHPLYYTALGVLIITISLMFTVFNN